MRATVAAVLLALLGSACGVAPAPAGAPSAPFVGEDLGDYYPNSDRSRTQYLQGDNYWPDGPRPSVLWFEWQDRQTFRIYNSAHWTAQARCSYDELSWRSDGYLRYARTVNACGAQRTEIVYDVPIVFLPQRWDGKPWRMDGQSGARYSVDGTLRCVGTNTWTAQILGVERIPPGNADLHWRTTQTTVWATGDVVGGCYAGSMTRWQEDYWLTSALAEPGGGHRARGLELAVGGNLDRRDQNWDIRMTGWARLPSRP